MRKGISSSKALCLVAIGIGGGGVVVENDFLIWSGEYEAYTEFQNELKQLV